PKEDDDSHVKKSALHPKKKVSLESLKINDNGPDGNEFCNFQPETGNCTGKFKVWYFEKKTEQCRKFVYSGCNGNKNRFKSNEECRAKCLNEPISSGFEEAQKTAVRTTTPNFDDETDTSNDTAAVTTAIPSNTSDPGRSVANATEQKVKQENITSKPDNITSKPDNITSKPDNSTTKADNSTIKPDNSTTKLDNSTTNPDNSIIKLENKTSEQTSKKENVEQPRKEKRKKQRKIPLPEEAKPEENKDKKDTRRHWKSELDRLMSCSEKCNNDEKCMEECYN
ncbi:isoinhibitor K-like protein, partial [Leptotrombidium deliense]